MQFARSIVNALEDKIAENIILMDIRGLAVFADFFVICSGTSERMLQALADAVNEHVHQVYSLPIHTEGRSQDGWLLVDAGDVIVHIFSPDRRSYYRLEDLWSHGKVLFWLQ